MTERRQRRVERQHYGQVEIVAALGPPLGLQAGTIERGKRPGAVRSCAAGRGLFRWAGGGSLPRRWGMGRSGKRCGAGAGKGRPQPLPINKLTLTATPAA